MIGLNSSIIMAGVISTRADWGRINMEEARLKASTQDDVQDSYEREVYLIPAHSEKAYTCTYEILYIMG